MSAQMTGLHAGTARCGPVRSRRERPRRGRRISRAAQIASVRGTRITGQAGEQPECDQARVKRREQLSARFRDYEHLALVRESSSEIGALRSRTPESASLVALKPRPNPQLRQSPLPLESTVSK